MNITFSEIAYLLSRKHDVDEVRNAYFDAPLESVKKYRGQAEKKQLYTISVNRVTDLIFHPVEKLSKCGFVAWGKGSEEEEKCWERIRNSKRIPVDIIYVRDVEFDEDLLEELVDMFFMLYKWDAQLKEDSAGKWEELSDLLNEGRRVIGLPMAVFDRNFIVLGCTEDYFLYFPDMKGRLINRQMCQADIKGLLQNDDYLNADEHRHIFLFPSTPAETNLLCYNIRFSGEFSARILMVIPEFNYHPGIGQLFTCFAKFVENVYLNNLQSYPAGNQDDTLHQMFKKYLFHPRKKDYEVDFHVLSMYNWFRYDEYQIIVLQIFGAREFEQGASYLCQQLERLFEYSCTFRTDREIIWIINYTRETAVRNREDFFSNFPYLIRDFGCKAGISDVFHDFAMLSNYRRQADIALEYGNKKDSYRWYYYFKDFTLDYMVGQMTTLFSAEQLAHKGLLKLYEYDREHDTEYVNTLKCYILSRFNASEAAQKLYIHRTTFIRRMERIENLISLDLGNTDELLHLLLSYRMFEGKGKLNE
ncbi:MAG: helix-turn-helix domain-containing protein [Lachnospiraceae bacterium]|nr:helix-turn-helix domain-containing protein [Lachnospiraceae bacterium]